MYLTYLSPLLLKVFRNTGPSDSQDQRMLENTDIFKLICIRSVLFGWKMWKQLQEKVNPD